LHCEDETHSFSPLLSSEVAASNRFVNPVGNFVVSKHGHNQGNAAMDIIRSDQIGVLGQRFGGI
jgi:hypothetical protein